MTDHSYAAFRRRLLPPFAAVAVAYSGALACCCAALSSRWPVLGLLLPAEVAALMIAGKMTR